MGSVAKSGLKTKTAKKTSKKKSPTMKDVANQMHDILSLLKLNLENAWKSEEKKKIEKQLLAGVKAMQNKVDNVITEVKSGFIEEKVLTKLYTGLKKLHRL